VLDYAQVLAWRMSNVMTSEFCVEALDEALALRRSGDLNTRTPDAL
jgi:hypothetical protein